MKTITATYNMPHHSDGNERQALYREFLDKAALVYSRGEPFSLELKYTGPMLDRSGAPTINVEAKPGPAKRNTYPVPEGWVLVTEGVRQQGDQYWQNDGWVTVNVTGGDPISEGAPPVIRNQLKHFELFPSGFRRSPRQG